MEKEVKIQYLSHFKGEKLKYAHYSDAGFDLRASIDADIVLFREYSARIPTGVRFEIPFGYELQIRPKSGLATQGLIIPNSPGTIDAGYRGEVYVAVMFLPPANEPDFKKNITIRKGMKIAQAVLAPVTTAVFVEVDYLNTSMRGEGGFGSTGQF
jgi:dUTP pyrophosphatase